MPRKPVPPPDDPEQPKRFIDLARDVQADGTEEDFIKAFRKVTSQPPRRLKPDRTKGQ
jgi:hypothetical protein